MPSSTPEPLDFLTAIAHKDRLVQLEAQRDLLAADALTVSGSALAAVMKQLREVTAEIDDIKPAEVSARDDIARKRAERRSAGVPDAAPVRKQRGAGSGGAGGKRRTGS